MANTANTEREEAPRISRVEKRKKAKRRKTRRLIFRILLVFGLVLSSAGGVMAAVMIHKADRALGMMNYDDKNKLGDIDLSKYKLSSDTEIVNILLVGTDKNAGESADKSAERRSDSMMIATLDIKHKKLKLTSLMRDMYVAIPGYGNQKLNAAYSYGGIGLLYQTIAENFGVQMDGYAEVNFDAFVNVIDLLGGIEVNLTQSESDNLNSTTYIKRKKNRHTTVGKQIFNGYQALGYVRIRHGAKMADGRFPGVYTASGKGDDFGRTERQRLTMQAILAKVKKLSPLEMIELASDVLPSVTTDIPKDDIFSYLVSIATMGTTKLHQFSLPMDGTWSDQKMNGQSVLVPDLEKNREGLKKFLFNS